MKRYFTYSLFIFLILFLVVSFYLAHNFLTRNVHTVIPGMIYRSAQLNHAELIAYQQKFHLKSMIDLRGSWPTNHWYRVESRFAKQQALHYYPIQFEAYLPPPRKQLQLLVHVLQTAPKPLLFHCEGGADRTGMAAAISVILFTAHPSIAEIQQQVSWRYNAISKRTVGYQMLRNYFAWLKQHHYTSSKSRFLEWVNSNAPMKTYQGWFVL